MIKKDFSKTKIKLLSKLNLKKQLHLITKNKLQEKKPFFKII